MTEKTAKRWKVLVDCLKGFDELPNPGGLDE